MSSVFRFLGLFSCLLLLLVAGVAGAAEPDVKEGRTRFNRGVELFREGDFAAAMIEFRRAYEVAPNYRVLFNIGQTAFELKDYAAALDAFERYLNEGGKDVPAKRRKMVTEEIEKLKTRVADVEIKASTDGAEIYIDDVAVGTSPLAKPVRVSAGLRKFSATREGVRVEKRIEIAGGDTKTIELELTQSVSEAKPETSTPARPTAPEPAVTPTEPTRDRTRSGGLPTGAWIGIAVTGALTAGAIVSGVFAMRAKNDYDDRLDTFGSDPDENDKQRDRTKQLALVTDILAGAAVAAGAITVYIALSADDSPSKGGVKSPRIGVGPRGVSFAGSF